MEMYKEGVSVIICCYNSSSRLPVTLQHLADQQVDAQLQWEIVVVDNASTDKTAEVAYREWNKYTLSVPLRVVDQPVPGQSAARAKGIEAADYNYLLFVDDDNWLHSDYVQSSCLIMSQDQSIGVLGGYCDPAFEVDPPEWFFRKPSIYAVGKQAEVTGYLDDNGRYLYGAASVIRKSAIDFLRDKGFNFLTVGRSGGLLTGGDDVELNKALRLAGYTLYYDERLYFKHLMTAGRLNWNYFLKIGIGGASSGVPLLVYDLFLQNENLSFARFNFLYFKNAAVRGVKIILKPILLVRYFINGVSEGDIETFELMRSLVFLKKQITSYKQATDCYYSLKKLVRNLSK